MQPDDHEHAVMQGRLLAFLDEYCRGLTLRDVREWYDDSFREEPTAGAS